MIDILIASIGFGLITVAILALAATGFTLQFSVTGVLNLAYADVMTVAGFAALALNQWWGWPVWAAIPVAGAVAAIISFGLNRAVLQPLLRRGTSVFGMLIATLALSLVIWNLVLAIVRPGFFHYEMPEPEVHRFLGQILDHEPAHLHGCRRDCPHRCPSPPPADKAGKGDARRCRES